MKSFQLFVLVVCFCLTIEESASVSNSSAYCGQELYTSDHGGTISFGPNSSPSKRCLYKIKVASGLRIVLKWSKFRVDGNMPSCTESDVTVYIGCQETKVAVFCTRNMDSLPHDIYSRDHCMSIKFTSTQQTSEEFAASYETLPDDQPIDYSSFCSSSKKLRKKSDVIYSPLWPKRSSSLYKKCGWDIELSQAYVIKVNFMDFDLLSTSSYDCKYSRERLKLKGDKSVLTSYKEKRYYCGRKSPFSQTTRYYELEFEYEAKYSPSSKRGFIAGYVAYKTDDTVKAATKNTRLAYIGLGIAVIVIIGCCIFFCLRRRRRQRDANHAAYHAPPAQEPTAKVITQATTVNYGTGPPPGGPAVPPPYSAVVNQPPYQGYPSQQYTPAPYPGAGPPYPGAAAPYPGAAAPYPGAAAPYPGAAAPHPGAAAPYPGAAAPYPGAAAPYPSGGAPYPPTSAQGDYPTKESYAKSADPAFGGATAPPYSPK